MTYTFSLYWTLDNIESDKTLTTKQRYEKQKEVICDFAASSNNPIFNNAVNGIKSTTQANEEISKINEGYRKFVPRSKNKDRDKTISDLEELIGEQPQLRARGFLFPDNILMTTIELGYAAFIGGLLAPEYSSMTEPYFAPMLAVPLIALFSNVTRFRLSDTYETEFLDKKIQEFKEYLPNIKK